MNKILLPILVGSLALLSSCTTPAPPPAAAASVNPLLGTWKFDFTSSVVYNAAYAANAGLSDAQQAQTKKFIGLMEGSTVTFTADTISTVADGNTESMKYTVKSSDANGNVVIANSAGAESTYSVSGTTLSNTVPEYNFVTVYKKQ